MRALTRLVIVAVCLWAPLSISSGYGLATVGLGESGAWWLAGCSALAGLLFSWVLTAAFDGAPE